jgi:SAM-dependent methyltransferase
MSAPERRSAEIDFHDRQAAVRAADLADDHALRFADHDYLDHETWIRPALARLGDVRDRSVLDFGCGHGMAAVVLARRGARVVAFDLSHGYLAEARRRAAANQIAVDFVLHHLDPAIAARELHRVLKPGGVAVFCEPWGDNPFLRFARRRLPYRGKGRTEDEEPLRSDCLASFRKSFPRMRVEGHQLLSMVRRVWRSRRLLAGLDRVDRRLLTAAPFLQRLCRYVVLTLPRDG